LAQAITFTCFNGPGKILPVEIAISIKLEIILHKTQTANDLVQNLHPVMAEKVAHNNGTLSL